MKLPPRATTARYRDEAAITAETWPAPIASLTPDMRLRHMHHITTIGSDAGQIERFFSDLLGMRLVKRTVSFDDPSSPHLSWGAGDGAPGTIVTYFTYPLGAMRPVRHGSGMTHHFASSVADEDALDSWRDDLTARDVSTTDIIDRAYYRSIALRDPAGHVIEIASASPGFVAAESATERGRTLRLPPGLEPRRREIEQNLKPLTVPEPIGR